MTLRQPNERHVCSLCNREGVKGFILLDTGSWVCRSATACERRIRGTGRIGVGVMRSYVR